MFWLFGAHKYYIDVKFLFFCIFCNKRNVGGCNTFLFLYLLFFSPLFRCFLLALRDVSPRKGLTLICYQTIFETSIMTYFQELAEVSLGLGGSPSDQPYWHPSHFIHLFIWSFMSWKSVSSPQQIYFFKSGRISLSLSCGSTTKLTIYHFHIDHNKSCFIPPPTFSLQKKKKQQLHKKLTFTCLD